MFNFLDLIYPPVCGFCKEINKNNLCRNCEQLLKKYEIATINKIQNKNFEYIINMLKYEGIVRNEIINYKFNENSYLYATFAKIILKNKKICSFLQNYDIIIPVPMYKTKRLKRGYNQSELIAKLLAKDIGLECPKNSLIKIKDTKVQSLLNKTERYKNIKNAFLANTNVNNKKIVLFDDIYTTGNTVNECSRVLKNAGAQEILVLTLAKD